MGLEKPSCLAIQTARAGSVGVPSKNTMLVNGLPLFSYPLLAAHSSDMVTKICVSTDDEEIVDWCNDHGNFHIIHRPEYLSTSDASHHDVIIHAMKEIGHRYDYVLLLLGNTSFTKPEDIDRAIAMLEKDSTASSVLSVTKFNMFNPHRAFLIEDNVLTPFVTTSMPKNSNDRNAFPSTYFFNGSFCICRYASMLDHENTMPYSWIGKNPIPFVQEFAMELDAEWQIPLMRC